MPSYPDVVHRRFRLVSCLALAGVLLPAAGPGCASGTARPAAGERRMETMTPLLADPDSPWPFWPQRMRIHPLTQFVNDRETDERLLEARIEFFDQFGHTCKAAGLLLIALFDADSPLGAEPMMRWESDLADHEENWLRYDEVTRTYLFRLEIDPERELPAEVELEAQFHTPKGAVFQAAYAVTE